MLAFVCFALSISCCAALQRDDPRPTRRLGGGKIAQDAARLYDGAHLVEMTSCEMNYADIKAELLRKGCQLIEVSRAERGNCTSSISTCSSSSAGNLDDAKVLHKDVGSILREKNRSMQEWNAVSARSLSDAFYDSYRSLADLEQRLEAIAGDSGGIATFSSLQQKSVLGNHIRSITIQGKDWTTGDARVVVTCQLHAREWLAGMSCAYAAESAASLAQSDAEWLKKAQLVIVPVVNPDGFLYSSTSDRFWRKNRNEKVDTSCVGVDLNRNFDVDFAGASATSNDACDIEFHGPSARSEPESKAVDALLSSKTHVHLDVHTFGCDVMGPWGYTNTAYKEKSLADKVGGGITAAMKSVNSQAYKYGTGGALTYLASGMISDYSSSKGALGYTIELPPCDEFSGMDGFAPSGSLIRPTGKELFEALRYSVTAAKEMA
eukprot:TRINITY_DN31729_c0_g1_i1.p1 TRINITY_DN31729_c0_g1~~TRINITY_DN31729_c0_g1_i1.p1  ORF type:complete len:451 (-),score=79.20 TRINITY_DN31729_c0_g1_i1:19-1323(-)